MSSWLTLQEYSNEQGVSISTLRRKIKERSIEHTFKKGKYFLKAPEKEGRKAALKEMETRGKSLLNEKEKEIRNLKEDCQGLARLLDEKEKEIRILKSACRELIRRRGESSLKESAQEAFSS